MPECLKLVDGEMQFLPGEINSTSGLDLATQFHAVFGSAAARQAKNVVYFFVAELPVPRMLGSSRVLYIGKTEGSLHQRYFRYAKHLATNRSGRFYQHVIKNFGAIRIAYVNSTAPGVDERTYFKRYIETHLEYPPKSKVG